MILGRAKARPFNFAATKRKLYNSVVSLYNKNGKKVDAMFDITLITVGK